MYTQETGGVVIRVEPSFLESESDPEAGRFVWTYTVVIENTGGGAVQLMEREWRITDSANRTEIVRGEGVVGEQPVIRPGSAFRYTSGAPLRTPSGFMRGAYVFRCENGQQFSADIPAFALDSPLSRSTRH
ncbi:Co2+/Mg2+ efflux protein ApaG [Hyphomonadaceae bacterium ML37]|nr:Co2+/Mg2+ efflux protein ApaG [Hyphomonadaceae bacterium ML37]